MPKYVTDEATVMLLATVTGRLSMIAEAPDLYATPTALGILLSQVEQVREGITMTWED